MNDARVDALAVAYRRRTELWDKPVNVEELGSFLLEGVSPNLDAADKLSMPLGRRPPA